MRPLVLALLLAPLLAGCLSPDAPAADAEDVAAANATTQADDLPEGVAPNGTAARAVPVSLAGVIPTHAMGCVYVVVQGVCASTPGEWNNHVEVAERGNVTGTLTLTWTASSPATQEMYVSFYGYDDEEWHEVGFAVGPSPLTLTVADALDAGKEYNIYVNVPGEGAFVVAAGGFGRAAQEQAFTLEGALTFA